MTRRDDSDLIGDVPDQPARRRGGRPRKDDLTAPSNRKKLDLIRLVERRRAAQQNRGSYGEVIQPDEDDTDMNIGTVLTGVSPTWLARAFETPLALVQKKIKGVRPAGVGRSGGALYSLKDVAGRLVDVEFDLKLFLANVKDEDLPESLRLKFWQARRQRQKVELEDGALWRTEKVLAVFGEVLLSLREKIQALPDRVERLTGMTTEQYRLFRAGTDEVMDDLQETILQFAQHDQTPVGMDDQDDDEDDLI